MRNRSNDALLPILSMDFETSGFAHEKGQPIEFGAVLADQKTLEPISTFNVFFKIHPGFAMSPEAQDIHGISPEWLSKHGVSFLEAAEAFEKWVISCGLEFTPDRAQVVALGQNLSFDMDFFKIWMGEKWKGFFHYHFIDTMILGKFLNHASERAFGYDGIVFMDPEAGIPSVSLTSQAAAFGFPTEGAHSAMFDAACTLDVYRSHVIGLAADLQRSREYSEMEKGVNL